MLTPAYIVAPENTHDTLFQDPSLHQIANVAQIPGIQPHPWVMPDMHEGYGFPIGGVAATAIEEGGIISPGGIGYDINCGVRLLVTTIPAHALRQHADRVASQLQKAVPSGLVGGGPIPLTKQELYEVITHGSHALHAWGYGKDNDLIYCESQGCMEEADISCVSNKAIDRGRAQLGTLGSGNHFLEIQQVSDIYDRDTAATFGLEEDMVTIMIHSGSRGFGHHICTDYVRRMADTAGKSATKLPDPALACAPYDSPTGHAYYAAMSAAANFAWANRHAITHAVRTALKDIFGNHISVETVYDISHNIGKKEQHNVRNAPQHLMVHRKGATRAFGPNAQDTPDAYTDTGHPVLIPGSMGTSSFVMVGQSDNQAFGSCCHGAGRVMSRRKARHTVDEHHLRDTLEQYNVLVKTASRRGLIEEAPHAYKDVINVVNTVSCAHLASPVARMIPRVVIKG